MPKKTFVIEIEWDWPDEDFWLPADSVALALHAYCENTNFTVTEAAQHNVQADAAIACANCGAEIEKPMCTLCMREVTQRR